MAEYIGGGVQNIGRPIGDYRIVDEGKKNLDKSSSVDSEKSFSKILKNTRPKEVKKVTQDRGFISEASRIKKSTSDHVMKLEVQRRGVIADKAAAFAKANKLDDGIDFALKQVAKKFGTEYKGFLWEQMGQTIESNSKENFGVKMWSKSLWPEYVKSGESDGLDEIEEAIYQDLKRAKIKEFEHGN